MSFQTFIITLLLAITPILGVMAALSLATLFIIFVFISFLPLSAIETKLKAILEFKTLLISLLAFLLFAGLSSIYSIDFRSSVIAAIKLSLTAIFGFYSLVSAKNFKGISPQVFIYSYIITLMLCIFEYFSHGWLLTNINHYFLHKDISYVDDYLNRGIAFITISIWIIVSYFLKKNLPIIAYVCLILATIIVLLFASDSAKVGIIISLFVFIFAKIVPKYIAKIFPIGILVAAITFPIICYNLIYNEGWAWIADQLPWTFVHRLHIWQNTIDLILLKPYLGWGFNASRILAELNLSTFTFKKMEVSFLPLHPHNLILQILLELGIVGLLLYLSIWITVISIISKSLISSNTKSALYASLASYLAVSQSSFDIWMSWWLSAIFIVAFIFLIFEHVTQEH